MGRANELHNLIVANADDIGRDVEHISHDSRTFQYVVKKYGFPDSSKVIYSENPTDLIKRYTITFPIFKGQDTMWNWSVREIYLVVDFGPTQYNSPKKIENYEIVFDRDVDLKN